MQVQPDWTKTGDKAFLESYFGSSFEVKGPGLYLTDADTVLLTTVHVDGTEDLKPSQISDVYRAYVYNVPYQMTVFAYAAVVPVRVDSRGANG